MRLTQEQYTALVLFFCAIPSTAAPLPMNEERSFWNSLKHDVETGAKDVASIAGPALSIAGKFLPEAAEAAKRDIEQRDPNFWNTVKADAKKGVEDVGKVAGPLLPFAGTAWKYGKKYLPEIAEGAEDVAKVAKRDPNFWQTVKSDAKKGAEDVASAAPALMGAWQVGKKFLPEAAEGAEDVAKVAKRDPNFWQTVKSDAKKGVEDVASAAPALMGAWQVGKKFLPEAAEGAEDIAKVARRVVQSNGENSFPRIQNHIPIFHPVNHLPIQQTLPKFPVGVLPELPPHAVTLRDLEQRDPSKAGWEKFKHGAETVGQDALNVVEQVGPVVASVAPFFAKGKEEKRDLEQRDASKAGWEKFKNGAEEAWQDVSGVANAVLPAYQAVAPFFEKGGEKEPIKEKRDPFWNSVKNDAEKALPIAEKVAPFALDFLKREVQFTA